MEAKIEDLHIIETEMVTPSQETPKHTVWLSNLDLLAARAHTPTVYFYRRYSSTTTENSFFSPAKLKAALSETLVSFYPMAGRLGVSDDDRLEIRCTGEGVLFVVARCNSSITELGDFAPSQKLRELLVPSANSPDLSSILVMFQLTFFSCGGVCLGAAVHHAAADGLGSLHFINSWADIAAGAGALAVTPLLDRTVLRARDPPTVLFDHLEYSPKPLATGPPPEFDSAVLTLSKSQLNYLKHRGENKTLSTFRAVVAHVWRSTCKARGLIGSDVTRLYIAADARTRLNPPLPFSYLGNAVFRITTAARADEIVNGTLEHAAGKVEEATKKLNDEYVRSLIDMLETKKDEVKWLQIGSWQMGKNDAWVTSWQGLPIYEADFGWGKPIYMGRASLQLRGLVVYIMNAADEDKKGELVLAVAMEPENMGKFKEVFYDDLSSA